MEKKTTKPKIKTTRRTSPKASTIQNVSNINPNLRVIDPKDVKRGDTIYIENTLDAVPYFVIDMGNPYMLIENLNTGFGNIYHYKTLYTSNS